MSKESVVRRALCAAAGVIVLMGLSPGPARALAADPITVQPGQSAHAEYGPIPGQDPATPQVLGPVDPGVCEVSPGCNVILLEFVAPEGFNPEDDTYLAEMEVNWETTAVGDRNVGAASNDLDLYVWAAAWAETEPGEPCHVPDPPPEGFEPPEYCTHNLSKSAGLLPPERVRFDATSHLKYLLVINNSTGPNVGYTIDIKSRYERFTGPKGLPDAEFVAPAGGDTGFSSSSSSSSSGGSSPSFDDLTPAGDLGGSQFNLDPIAGGPDDELSSLNGGGLPGANFLGRPAESAGPPGPVSGATVALWLAVLPVVLGGAAAYWFVRRRPSALRINFPAAKPA